MKVPIAILVVIVVLSYGLVFVLGPDSEGKTYVAVVHSDWRVETISSTSGAMMENTVALSKESVPHVAFYPPGEVRYGKRGPEVWDVELIDKTPFGGAPICMALDRNGTPHIIYDSVAWTHSWLKDQYWEIETIPGAGGGRKECDATYDTRGNLHISYATQPPGGLQGDIKYARFDGLAWAIEEIDEGGKVSTWASIATDSFSRPHVLYYGDVYREVRYAVRTDLGWSIETLENIGHILYGGKHGSIALDSTDVPHVAYLADVDIKDHSSSLRYGLRIGDTWQISTVDSEAMRGFYPGIDTNQANKPSIGYQSWGRAGSDLDLMFATQNSSKWEIERVYDDPLLGVANPSFSLDSCGNPHISFHVYTDRMLKYATKGPPCIIENQSVSLDIDPDTLNLKSRGRWITAYLSAENASVYDIDISSIRLQDTLEVERYDYQDDILMLKFDRQEFEDAVQVGESVQVKMTGKWKDGSDFEAYDDIRVICPGKKDKP